MAKKTKAPKLGAETELEFSNDKVLVFKVNRVVTDKEFELIENRLMVQQEKTGIKIMLVPYSVEFGGEIDDKYTV